PCSADHRAAYEPARIEPREELGDRGRLAHADEGHATARIMFDDDRLARLMNSERFIDHFGEERVRTPRRRDGHPVRVHSALAFGFASTPASLRCSGVIGAGACVSGSEPPPDLGKAMTSRMDSDLVRSAMMRSQPNAIPPCGGAPNANASRRKPNFSRASSSPIPMILNTRSCTSPRWIRIDPPPISLPLQTMSQAYAVAAAGSSSNRSIHSSVGEVKAWWTAVHAPPPTATSSSSSSAGLNSGASTTQTKDHASSSIKPVR